MNGNTFLIPSGYLVNALTTRTVAPTTTPVPTAPAGDSVAVEQAARMLIAAESPVLVVDRLARTPNGMKLLVELAEFVGAGVVDQTSRMNFPTRHPLNQSLRAGAAIGDADLVIGLEVADFWASVNSLRDQLHRSTRSITKPGVKLITITTGDLYVRANYQDFRRLPFGAMPELLAHAEFVDKLQAVCHRCGGTATTTQRLVDGEPAPYSGETVVIGALDSYEARCRDCHQAGEEDLASFAQRRRGDRNHVQPVEQVAPETASLYRLRQVAVGGCNHPHVHLDRTNAAQPLELPLL